MTAAAADLPETEAETMLSTENLTFAQLPDKLKQTAGISTATESPTLETVDSTNLYSFTTINADGSKTLHSFNAPIKYIDDSNNEIKFIDNTIKSTGIIEQTIGKYKFENTENDVKLYLPKKLEGGIKTTFKNNDVEILPSADGLSEPTLKSYSFLGTEHHVAEYENAFGDGAHLQYEAINTGIKENIFLESFTGKNEFEFILKCPGYTAEAGEYGDIFLKDSEGNTLFTIGRPWAKDSENNSVDGSIHLCTDNYYTTEPLDDGVYKITMVIDKDWLAAESTVYPVLIDPTLSSGKSNLVDTTVYYNNRTYNDPSAQWLAIGKHPNLGYAQSVIRLKDGYFDNYKYINPNNVTSAVYNSYEGSGNTVTQVVQIFESGTAVAIGDLTYDTVNNGKLSETVISSTTLTSSGKYYSFDIKSMIKKWMNDELNGNYADVLNYGFIFRTQSTQNIYRHFASADNSSYNSSINITYNEDTSMKDGVYFIKNVNSYLYLNANGNTSGSAVTQRVLSDELRQQWKVTHLGGGIYEITPLNAENLRLDVYDGKYNNGQKVHIYNANNTTAQRWRIIKNPDNVSYRFMPESSGSKCLEVAGAYTHDWCNVQLWEWEKSSAAHRKWIVESILNFKTFSAFDVGNSTEDEAGLVKSWMLKAGYLNIGTFNNANGYVSADKIKQTGLYSDIIYINGHGDRAASLSVQDSQGAWKEYLSAASNMTHYYFPSISETIIGADFLSGSTTKTNSYWNKKTKWGILAQCSQMNIGTEGSGNHWNGLNNAQIWARTMLGDGHRVHGYLGYYDSAPGSVHYDRLNNFFDEAVDKQQPIPIAWKNGHTRLFDAATNWAVIYHSANYNDTLSNMTASTASGSAYSIYLWRHDRSAAPITLNTVRQNNKVFGFAEDIKPNFDNVSVSFTDNLLTSAQKQSIAQKLPGGTKTDLAFEDGGRIEYRNFKTDYGKPGTACDFDESTAVNMAKSKLSDLGLLPDGGYRIEVSKSVRQKLNLESGGVSQPEVMDYSVKFYRQLNGMDLLSDEDDGIVVDINRSGVSRLSYRWRNMKINKLTAAKIISKDAAKNIYIDDMASKCAETRIDAKQSSAYALLDGKVIPVWIFSEGEQYSNITAVNAITGEVIK